MKGGGFSILDIFRMGSGILPVISKNFYWYSLILIVVATSVFAGRFYCGWICPFGTIQKVLYKIVPVRFELDKKTSNYLKLIKYVVLFGLLVMYFLFLKKELAIRLAGGLEPFAAFFKVHAKVIVWIWIAIVLLISSCVFRFYCWCLCPAGAFFALISRASSFLRLRRVYGVKQEGAEGGECFMCAACSPGCFATIK